VRDAVAHVLKRYSSELLQRRVSASQRTGQHLHFRGVHVDDLVAMQILLWIGGHEVDGAERRLLPRHSARVRARRQYSLSDAGVR